MTTFHEEVTLVGVVKKLHRALWSDVVQDPLRCVLRGLAALLDQGGQRNHLASRTYAA
jgi:hypothetical protein